MVIGGFYLLGKSLFKVVRPDELAALEWMGGFRKILSPGLHFMPPGSSIRKIKTRVTENRTVTETKTKDNVFVQVHIAVQQEVHREYAYEAIYKLSDPRVQIESFVSDVVRSHVPTKTVDELFQAKDEIAQGVRERLTEAMASYGYLIHQVLVTDISPDKKVKAAMNQINANRRLRLAAEEKAEADKIILVKQAEAEAESKFLQGQGTARCRSAIVEGLKEAVVGDSKTSLKPEEVTELLLLTQYLDTVEKVSQGASSTLYLSHSVGGLGQAARDIRSGILDKNAMSS
eukprot:TRINITY_DN1641_c0_g1_i1.p1 TRINITY_DN1641_c0_g1~~TRINITY_DN1641_c0_g1_i1.p1  ORF type:complete len:325 (-),score=38.49 TRINITY_DN1641_c0_g1_i1:132-995(-)